MVQSLPIIHQKKAESISCLMVLITLFIIMKEKKYNNSVNIIQRLSKSVVLVLAMVLEGTVSQIFLSRP